MFISLRSESQTQLEFQNRGEQGDLDSVCDFCPYSRHYRRALAADSELAYLFSDSTSDRPPFDCWRMARRTNVTAGRSFGARAAAAIRSGSQPGRRGLEAGWGPGGILRLSDRNPILSAEINYYSSLDFGDQRRDGALPGDLERPCAADLAKHRAHAGGLFSCAPPALGPDDYNPEAIKVPFGV